MKFKIILTSSNYIYAHTRTFNLRILANACARIIAQTKSDARIRMSAHANKHASTQCKQSYLHSRKCAPSHTHKHTHTLTHIYIHTYARAHTHTHTHKSLPTSTHTYMNICTHVHAFTQTFNCTRTCTCSRTYIFNMCMRACLYIYIRTHARTCIHT